MEPDREEEDTVAGVHEQGLARYVPAFVATLPAYSGFYPDVDSVSFAILGISIALVVVFLVFQQRIIDGLKPFGDWLHRFVVSSSCACHTAQLTFRAGRRGRG